MAEEPQYLLPEPGKKAARLTEQDTVITHIMNGQRIPAPIDLTKPGLCGSWTRERPKASSCEPSIQPLLAEPFTLLGYDLTQGFFASAVPPHTTLAIHDVAEPWPAGAGTDYGKDMAGWLREEGFENVHDKRVNLNVGARLKDTEWATRSAKILVEAFTGVVGALMKLDLPSSLSGSLGKIPERAEEEMMKQGGTYPLVFAFAQKPAAL